jgi:DNA polymerase-1
MPPILYLIDGHALAYRTFFALTATGGGERLSTSSGEPTAGIYGFASVILRLLEQEHPEYLAVAFDAGHSFRDTVFSGYKATRAKMPDDLRSQMARIRQLVDAFCFPRLELEGYEADDVLGSISRQAVEKGFGVKIITGDRDLLQLVDDRILVNLAGMKLSEAKDYTAQGVLEYLGVRPDQVVDYKALVGDTSDNIPGVSGIGDKTATSLLATYQTLDEIYAHLEDLPTRVRNRLEAGRDSAYLSKQLATILTDVQVTLDVEKARTDHFNLPALEGLFRELEFRALTDRLRKVTSGFKQAAGSGAQLSLFGEEVTRVGTPQPYQLETRVVDTPEALADLKARLEAADIIAVDTETTSTDPLRCRLVGMSLAVQPGEGFYIPVGHVTGEPQLALANVIAAIGPVLADPKKAKVGHNLKYDGMVLKQNGLEITPMTFDTMIAEWLVNPASHNLGLKAMADYYLSISMTHIEELIGKGKSQITMDLVPVAQAAPYAAADAEVSLRLQPVMQKHLEEHNAHQLLHTLEMPLIPVLELMEENGVALDIPYLQSLSGDLTQRLTGIEQNIYDAVGYSFNINSTQQLSKVLFEALKLAPPDRRKRTSSGHYSTSAEVLDELRGQHPVVDMVLEYRELAKLKSTYVDALPLQVNPRTGRVHTVFNQTGSVTGRLASSEPNLQNIPTRTEEGRRVRRAFVAGDDKALLSVDYSQIELRIVAHMSGDEAMQAAFNAGQDIHAATAAAIYGVPLNKVSKDQRRNAKSINFGLIYGISAFGLARYSGLTLAEAENFSSAYFRQFPGVKDYLDGLRRLAASQGYVETLLGRRRYFPNLRDQSNFNLRNREEREAINAPIQGSAADIMKLAMIRLPEALETEKLTNSLLLLQVHDELLLECPRSELERTARVVRRVMEEAYPLSIPLATEARSGKNWEELQPLVLD